MNLLEATRWVERERRSLVSDCGQFMIVLLCHRLTPPLYAAYLAQQTQSGDFDDCAAIGLAVDTTWTEPSSQKGK